MSMDFLNITCLGYSPSIYLSIYVQHIYVIVLNQFRHNAHNNSDCSIVETAFMIVSK